MAEQAADSAGSKFLVQGTGHWIMVVAVWIMTLGAGIKVADWDAGLLSRFSMVAVSAFFWLVALRRRPSKS